MADIKNRFKTSLYDEGVNSIVTTVSAVAQGRASDSRLRGPGFESCPAVLTLRKFFHSTLLQSTQLYK